MGKLFDINEVQAPDLRRDTQSGSISEECRDASYIGKGEMAVRDVLPNCIAPGTSLTYMSNGDWSMYQLVDYLLEQTGRCSLYLATWSISEFSARKLTEWLETGRIASIHGLLDYRSKNRHPAAYHLAKSQFSTIRVAYCHAKVTVLHGGRIPVSVNGSANWTENPRIETGVISASSQIADFHKKWITEMIETGDYEL